MSPIIGETLRVWLLSALVVHVAVAGNPDAKRLYDDLLSNYNKLVRPVVNTSDVLRVCIKLKLSQLIDVNLKNQIMTTNLWVEQSWYDYKLRWEPKEYGGVHMLHVPSDHIWRPDIVLYNNTGSDTASFRHSANLIFLTEHRQLFPRSKFRDHNEALDYFGYQLRPNRTLGGRFDEYPIFSDYDLHQSSINRLRYGLDFVQSNEYLNPTPSTISNFYKQKILNLEADCSAGLNQVKTRFIESLQSLEDYTIQLETHHHRLDPLKSSRVENLPEISLPFNFQETELPMNEKMIHYFRGDHSREASVALKISKSALIDNVQSLWSVDMQGMGIGTTVDQRCESDSCGLIYQASTLRLASSQSFNVPNSISDITLEENYPREFNTSSTYPLAVDLRHMDEKSGSNVVEVGVDLSEFYMSVEWDILEVPAVRNEKFYTCCDEPYLDITFNITMRRKTLFYTVNIIIPCMGISFLTVLTFYLPSDSGEKVTLSISILISLHVFFLLVVEIIPPTSLVVPLLGKYLIFAMILVSISICVTVVVLNVHFRSPQTHRMAPWVKRVFIHILPRLLVMRRPQYKFETNRYSSGRVLMRTVRGKEKPCYYPYHPTAQDDSEDHIGPKRFHSRVSSKEDLSPSSLADGVRFGGSCQIHGPTLPPLPLPLHSETEELTVSGDGVIEEMKSPVLRTPPAFSHSNCPPELHRSCICVRFIAEHTKMLEDSTKVKEDWKYVAMVLDRLFLWIFTLAVLVGTAGIILQAPTLYDDRVPIDKKFSEFATTTVVRCPPQ